ncbi:unnamed protein product [Spirodela intermedia]|uniref:Reverse transcriptase RNase H-like domain-containing protein n=1 Tax=Spirodela intermedia TaxID=51605 RepID=A0A7I8L3S3_SPIIN|nr:unnamed protein product [Spirodela intermedia]
MKNIIYSHPIHIPLKFKLVILLQNIYEKSAKALSHSLVVRRVIYYSSEKEEDSPLHKFLVINVQHHIDFLSGAGLPRYAVCVDGIKVDEKKVRAIEVCFHGLTPFYGRFIRNFSSIMSPVTTCMEKGQFKWTNEAIKSFIMIKKKLCSAHGLAFLNFDKLFEAECDASIVGIGGVQSEEGRPIAFFRGKLSEVRKKWTTYELEFYDVVQASQTWEHYLIQRKFIFYTDHQALKISKYQTFIDRMHASWSSFIQRFTFVMKHRKTACLLNLRAEITRFDYLKELYLNDDDFSQHNI